MLLNKNKALLASSLVLSLLGTQIQAAELTISGQVAQDCTVSLDTASYTNLNIIAGGSFTAANLTETCNDPNGYDISFSSGNAGVLENDQLASVTSAYTLTYGADITAQTLGAAATAATTKSSSTTTTGTVVPITINLAANATAPAGTYADIITINIAGK